jgi:signal transduction histidine kinase
VELSERVFDPFFTRREGGIGLGLTIVQQIVQVHRGDIRVTNSPWGGACFLMRFDNYDGPGGR